jgi:hypothetical protein
MMRMDASIAASERTQGRRWKMECPKCVSVIGGFAHLKSPAHLCTKCGIVITDWQQSEIESLRSELSTLEQENQRLRSGLEKLEWSDVQWDSQFCPVCTMEPHEGHNPDCWLSALLKGDSNAN